MEKRQDQDVAAVELEGVFWTGWNMGQLMVGKPLHGGDNLLFTTSVKPTWPPASFS
jgi:hypothetical protein